MTTAVLILLAWGCIAGAVAAVWQRSNAWLLWLSGMYAFYGIADMISHGTIAACIMAALCAVFLWLWWTSGGGKKTKRRLKKARRFIGVRRTAPVTT